MMMIWRYIKFPINLACLGIILNGCVQSDYTKLVKSELAKGIRKDSILLGINLGDSRNEFYGKCTDLNADQLITQGPSGSVLYNFTDSLVHTESTPIRMLFNPAFDEYEKLFEMHLELSYQGWSSWNPKFQSDSLKVKMMQLLMVWYKGNKFVTANVNDSTEVPVKLDGNRRLLVYVKDRQSILIKVQDILHPRYKHSTSQSVRKKDSEN
jgi:hypothetical protein